MQSVYLIWILIGVTGVLANFLDVATAQEQPEQTIRNRIASYREIGTAFKHIGDSLKSRNPDLGQIRESAQLIKDRGANMLRWFPPGSEPPPEVPKSWLDRLIDWFSSNEKVVLPDDITSHAKHVVWSQKAEFERAHAEFAVEAERMVQAAQSAQATAMSIQLRRLGESCKSCHDVFRARID